MVANDVSAPGVGFDHDTNAVTILGADGTVTEVPLAGKHAIAGAVFDRVVALLAAQRGPVGPSWPIGPDAMSLSTRRSADRPVPSKPALSAAPSADRRSGPDVAEQQPGR